MCKIYVHRYLFPFNVQRCTRKLQLHSFSKWNSIIFYNHSILYKGIKTFENILSLEDTLILISSNLV